MIDPGGLMMIEPKANATEYIEDDLTQTAMRVFEKARANPALSYKGVHTCVCGKVSDNRDWRMPDGRVTNSLLVHYIAQHRDEVPDDEIAKLRAYEAN